MTGQVKLDSYADTGVHVAIDLVNELAVASPDDPVAVIRRVLAVDPPSLRAFVPADVPGFVALAADLHTVFDLVGAGRLDPTATLLNHMLATHPSHPHLALEDGVWRLHHHPVDAELIPMWTAICPNPIRQHLTLPSFSPEVAFRRFYNFESVPVSLVLAITRNPFTRGFRGTCIASPRGTPDAVFPPYQYRSRSTLQFSCLAYARARRTFQRKSCHRGLG